MNNNRNCLTRDAGLELVKSFYSSGLRQKEFCAANNVAYHILQYWKQIKSKVDAESTEQAKFLPVKGIAACLGVKSFRLYNTHNFINSDFHVKVVKVAKTDSNYVYITNFNAR